MGALATIPASVRRRGASVTTPQDAAALIVAHFRAYNDEFGRITRRAAEHFLSGDGAARERDAVSRIELYEQYVAQALRALHTAVSAGPELDATAASEF
ncbi:MAG TPA: isocitrate dehydrogenase kinase/phosphatase AceK regulatory subunit, partial [Steroidobacteraceae bacterium]|nr:isocitrate dehydrogenase kinase/phosphatase AceK regulatory subunit [Steroidobacteraceae bacterium]